MIADQANVPALILKEDQVLSQNPDELRGALVGQLGREGHRIPIAAQKLTAWCTGADAGKPLILSLAQHCLSRLTVASEAPARPGCKAQVAHQRPHCSAAPKRVGQQPSQSMLG